jgi:hypothetical protein
VSDGSRSPAATRQLASRARRRVQGGDTPVTPDDRGRARRIVEAFLAASRSGDFGALLTLLDPDVVLSADADAVRMGASDQLREHRPSRRRSPDEPEPPNWP